MYDYHTFDSSRRYEDCATFVSEISTSLISVLPWAVFQVLVLQHQAHQQPQGGVSLAQETSLRISSSA